MTQFDRQASVIIGSPGEGGLQVSDLRIAFSVQKTDGKDPNKAKIKIFNLSEKSRNLIKRSEKDFADLVFLSAGYRNGAGLENVFIGNISSINNRIETPNIITEIDALDGAKEILERRLSISFGPGIKASVVLKKVLSSFSIGSDVSNLSPSSISYANGFSFAGAADSALDKVTRFMGLDWSIQNNEIKFVEFDKSDGTRIVSLTPDTGLIGSPQRLQGVTRKAKGKSKSTKPGWKIKALLRPEILPGGQVQIESREIPQNSKFTVSTVEHSGDTHGAEWISQVEVRET